MLTAKTIILVSDERGDRDAVLGVVRAVAPDCEITPVETPEEALKLALARRFDCVFAQLEAGPEESVDFLTRVWSLAPHAARFVLAPQIDSATQIRCAFGAHHFLSTPLHPKAVEAALANAEVKSTILSNERVQLLVSKIRSLPSKPAIYFQVLEELRSEDARASVIASHIQRDLGIASKLIQVVNSIFYGRAEPLHDIEEAVLFLGFEVTASIVLTLEAISRFEKTESGHHLIDEVWKHSQTVAELSRRIAHSCGQRRNVCDQAFLAGLLHDIGKLALARNFVQEYRQILRTVDLEGRSLVDLELETLGVTHADAGAYLLAVWGLPVAIVEAVALHHRPAAELEGTFSASTAVHLSEELLEGEKPLDEMISEYPAELGLLREKETLGMLVPDRILPTIPERRTSDTETSISAD